jgi:hypothetical protein
VSDIRFVRRLLFEVDVNGKADGWPSKMLQAVEVAKRLGFRNFEMDVTGEAAEESEEESKGVFMLSIADFFGKQAAEGEEWKSDKPDAQKKQGKKPRTLRVWAVVAVDKAMVEQTP